MTKCRSKGHPGALQRQRYALPLAKSVFVVTKRQITLMLRDGALTRGRFMQVCHHTLPPHMFRQVAVCRSLIRPTTFAMIHEIVWHSEKVYW